MNDSFEIRHELRGTRGRYSLLVDAQESEMTYSRDGDRMIIDRTFVPPAQRHRGLALVRRAVEDARTLGLKIVPICSYARAEMLRRPEWHDVRANVNRSPTTKRS